MSLHLVKLSVGSESVASMARWQAGRLAAHGRLWHRTRMMPRRAEELLDGGSIYWVVVGLISVRQRLTAITRERDPEDGTLYTFLDLDPTLVPVVPRAMRPFQGWRYLAAEAAPPDLERGAQADGTEEMPAAMRRELAELGLL